MARRRGATRKFIKELHVADVSDATRGRIVELFLPALGPEGKVFRYCSAKELEDHWENGARASQQEQGGKSAKKS
jgi:hypothetical protein